MPTTAKNTIKFPDKQLREDLQNQKAEYEQRGWSFINDNGLWSATNGIKAVPENARLAAVLKEIELYFAEMTNTNGRGLPPALDEAINAAIEDRRSKLEEAGWKFYWNQKDESWSASDTIGFLTGPGGYKDILDLIKLLENATALPLIIGEDEQLPDNTEIFFYKDGQRVEGYVFDVAFSNTKYLVKADVGGDVQNFYLFPFEISVKENSAPTESDDLGSQFVKAKAAYDSISEKFKGIRFGEPGFTELQTEFLAKQKTFLGLEAQILKKKQSYRDEGWHFTEDAKAIPPSRWTAVNNSPIFPKLYGEALPQIFSRIEELKSANGERFRKFIENQREAFKAGELPDGWKQEKAALEKNGWEFDFNEEKREWSGVHAKYIGVSGSGDFGSLLRIINKNIRKKDGKQDSLNLVAAPTEANTGDQEYILTDVFTEEHLEIINTNPHYADYLGKSLDEIKSIHGKNWKKKISKTWTQDDQDSDYKAFSAAMALRTNELLLRRDENFVHRQAGSFTIIVDGKNYHIPFFVTPGGHHLVFHAAYANPISSTGYKSDVGFYPINYDNFPEAIEQRVRAHVADQWSGQLTRKQKSLLKILADEMVFSDLSFERTTLGYTEYFDSLKPERAPFPTFDVAEYEKAMLENVGDYDPDDEHSETPETARLNYFKEMVSLAKNIREEQIGLLILEGKKRETAEKQIENNIGKLPGYLSGAETYFGKPTAEYFRDELKRFDFYYTDEYQPFSVEQLATKDGEPVAIEKPLADSLTAPTTAEAGRIADLVAKGWEIKQNDAGDWQGEKTFGDDETPKRFLLIANASHLCDLLEREEKNRAEIAEFNELPKFVVIDVKYELTDPDILVKTNSHMQFLRDRSAEIKRFAEEKLKHKNNLKMIDQRIEKVVEAIDSGHEWRETECALEYDFQTGRVNTIHPDTGESLKSRAMNKEELQKTLPFRHPEAKTEIATK